MSYLHAACRLPTIPSTLAGLNETFMTLWLPKSKHQASWRSSSFQGAALTASNRGSLQLAPVSLQVGLGRNQWVSLLMFKIPPHTSTSAAFQPKKNCKAVWVLCQGYRGNTEPAKEYREKALSRLNVLTRWKSTDAKSHNLLSRGTSIGTCLHIFLQT